jgi:hypothetical protein
LVGNQLVFVAGGLTAKISAADAPPGTLATALGLIGGTQPANGYLSGDLPTFPDFPTATAAVTVRASGGPPVVISFAAPTYLDAAAQGLQAALQAIALGTKVAVMGTRLLFLPPGATTFTFGPAPLDSTSVLLLQLHGLYNVRVRVNGSDSIDDVSVELPQ